MIAWFWSSFLRLIARNRGVTLALLSAVASTLMGLAATSQGSATGGPPWQVFGFAGAVLLIVLTGAVPSEYEVANRVDFMLPVIYRVLELQDGDRLTVHRLTSFPTKGYEQLTDYYPPQGKHTAGRRFPLSHGIVAQAMLNKHARAWAIKPGVDFGTAMTKEWLFTDDQLQDLTDDRRSFLAYPIGRHGQYARAVLYLDSTDGTRFSDVANPPIAPAAAAAPTGEAAIAKIAEYFDAQLLNAFKG
jgi:hypothetical protein